MPSPPYCSRLPLQQVLLTRNFATGTGTRRPSRFKSFGGQNNTLSLEHFLQRSRVLSLYRRIVRGTHRIGDETTRTETLRFARGEFEQHRDVTDLSHIRYLISTGKTEWENMERYIGRS